ncbi:hypothetical protein H632_c694p1 [Helicosporidium sp. ATCC 50920]|nr:hypothetical protein H632_c694p1 [Helicosporidium sp. ATCC 50920]|eukprot:KDD75416.1 hypothetical protein H632_c694p1 [Helicosporidium sp. ATCC 50920]
MKMACSLVLLATLAVLASAGPVPNSANLEAIPDANFVFNPAPPNAIADAGYSQRRTSREWRALTGMGMSQTSFLLEPCAVRAPHIHQNANALLYAVHADSLMVGFVQENGKLVENTMTSGMSAVFPQGLVHYQFNNACTNATYVITYDDADGGTINIVPALLALPPNVVTASLGLNDTYTISDAPTTNFFPTTEECLDRCGHDVRAFSLDGRGRRLMLNQ